MWFRNKRIEVTKYTKQFSKCKILIHLSIYNNITEKCELIKRAIGQIGNNEWIIRLKL